jgi:hypothetical protein
MLPKRAGRKGFECFHHREMLNVGGDRYTDPNLNKTRG